jgi:glycosyltransferase involved in cell wall biosynthesis
VYTLIEFLLLYKIMSNEHPHILFISSWNSKKSDVLTDIFVRRYAAALCKEYKVSVIFITSEENAEINEYIDGNVYYLTYFYKKVNLRIPLFKKALQLFRYLSAWYKALKIFQQKRGKPNLIHVHVIFPVSLIVLYLKLRWRIPFIITEHWTGYLPRDGRYKGFFLKTLTKISVKKASAITTISIALMKRMLEFGLKNNYYVIPNPVDASLFKINPFCKKEHNFIHVSLFDDAQKNISGIVRVFAKFLMKHPHSTLTLVGDGDDRNSIQSLCEKLNIETSVCFTGIKTGNELVALLQKSLALISFSNYETQGVVLVESIYCGTPVIATNLECVKEFVNSKNGILVNPEDETGLYSAMETIFLTESSYTSINVRETLAEKFSYSTIENQYTLIYKNLMNHME